MCAQGIDLPLSGMHVFNKDFDGYIARSWITYNFGEPVLALVCLVQSEMFQNPIEIS
jgi:hypothetical protein